MNKYGIKHFSIKQLEECNESTVNEREQYWIQKLDTYKNGYNATLGGDSKQLYNYKDIVDKYLELQNQKETAEFFGCHPDTVKIACKQYNIKTVPYRIRKKVKMISLMNEETKEFSSMSEAGKWLISQGISNTNNIRHIVNNIGLVIKGQRKTAYGYRWECL